MPRKVRLLSSYSGEFYSLFEGATLTPVRIPTGSLKDAQYMTAELNQFRVSLRAHLHPFYPLAESVIISARGNPESGEVYMRTQEAEWSIAKSLLPEDVIERGRKLAELVKQEEETVERTKLNAPLPQSEDPFAKAMEMLAKKE